jgi:UDP-N-acetylmuramoyl-L-alanyl-D-glutamate--2,6-diaminopimelate ligase
MEEYYLAKRRLFTGRLKAGGAVVLNTLDDYGMRLWEELRASKGAGSPRIVAYGDEDDADVYAADVALDFKGIRGRIATPRGELRIETALLGTFNLENVLAAVAVGEALGLPHEAIATALREVPPVPGRMEAVDLGQPFPVLIDYAHTDDGLLQALHAMRALAPDRKLMVVFGCGGDRDRGKRPLMGKVAGELADLVVVTSDNPRSEDPQSIMAAIEEGVKASGNDRYRMLPDRRDAIRRAISIADREWAVLIAGKGNETGQEIAGVKHPFSDREEAVRALEQRSQERSEERKEGRSDAANGG